MAVKVANRLKIKVTLMEPMLGTTSSNPDIYRKYIATDDSIPAGNVDEEVDIIKKSVGSDDEDVDDKIQDLLTIFPKMEDGTPFLWDYQIRGFFKSACSMLSRVVTSEEKEAGTKGRAKKALNESSKIKAYKKIIDGLIFVNPRRIPIQFPNGEVIITQCQRPLRASTPKGERISIAVAEQIPAGVTFECEIVALSEGYMDAIKEWLDYGQYNGLLQWRNSGMGRFTYEILEEE